MTKPNWLNKLREYEGPQLNKSVLQLLTTVIPLLAILALMFVLIGMEVSYWYVLGLAVINSAFYVRTFIILHDCTHNSFFKKPSTCNLVGGICGYITFMPYYEFQLAHNIHHANTGNLDKRGVGDIWTLTVDEYLSAGPFKRIFYRAARHPMFFLIIGPPLLFLIYNRFPSRVSRKKQIKNIILLDVFIISTLILAYFTIGIWNYLMVMIPIHFIANNVGIWLFTIQHQYEGVYWERKENWNSIKAAIEGSSFYKLPKILQWATGNIGFHHIHHLKPRIPNYKLNRCYDEVSEMQQVKPITLMDSFKAMSFKLWDEEAQKLLKVSDLKKTRASINTLKPRKLRELEIPFRHGI